MGLTGCVRVSRVLQHKALAIEFPPAPLPFGLRQVREPVQTRDLGFVSHHDHIFSRNTPPIHHEMRWRALFGWSSRRRWFCALDCNRNSQKRFPGYGVTNRLFAVSRGAKLASPDPALVLCRQTERICFNCGIVNEKFPIPNQRQKEPSAMRAPITLRP